MKTLGEATSVSTSNLSLSSRNRISNTTITESDPIFTAWDKSDGILISQYQVNDGITGTLSSFITSLGSSNQTLIVDSGQSITGNTTIPSNISVVVRGAGLFTISNGVTLTINGPFYAGLEQVFTGAGTVTFGNNSVPCVYPQWWGGVPDGVLDQSTYINKAIATGVTCKITKGTWLCNLTITNIQGATLIGDGFGSILKTYDNTDPVIQLLSTTLQNIGTRIANITIDGNDLSTGIYMYASTPYVINNSIIENLRILHTPKAIHIASATAAEEVYSNYFNNIVIDDIVDGSVGSPNYGIYIDDGTYNTFNNISITNVGDYGYAVYSTGTNSCFKNIVTDGVIRSDGDNSSWIDVFIDTINAATAPMTPSFRLDGDNTTLIGLTGAEVDPLITDEFLQIFSTNAFVSKVKTYGTDEPSYLVTLDASSTGTLMNVSGSGSNPFDANSETILRNWNVFSSGETNVYRWATASPQTGADTWVAGDYVRNSSPSAGQPKGWVCTVGGTPGTWISEGNL